MTRMRVVLHGVSCRDTEDVTGGDEFYLAGAVTDGEQSTGVLTRPLSIKSRQFKLFGEGGGTVFDKEVPDNRILKVVLIAFDEDANKDWAKRGELVTKIGGAVSAGLKAIPNPYTAGAAVALPFVIQGVGFAMSLDQDDELGQHLREFPVDLTEDGESRQSFVARGGGGWWSSWLYGVSYRVIKG